MEEELIAKLASLIAVPPLHSSSCVRSVQYDFSDGICTINFTVGNSYDYDLSIGTVIGLLLADSPGKFFNDHIK